MKYYAGLDLQKDQDLKMQTAALFKVFLELNEMAQSDDMHVFSYTPFSC